MSKNLLKIIETLAVFVIGDVIGAPIATYWLNLWFPHPESGILVSPEVIFLLTFVLPGVIADFIWFKIKNIAKK